MKGPKVGGEDDAQSVSDKGHDSDGEEPRLVIDLEASTDDNQSANPEASTDDNQSADPKEKATVGEDVHSSIATDSLVQGSGGVANEDTHSLDGSQIPPSGTVAVILIASDDEGKDNNVHVLSVIQLNFNTLEQSPPEKKKKCDSDSQYQVDFNDALKTKKDREDEKTRKRPYLTRAGKSHK